MRRKSRNADQEQIRKLQDELFEARNDLLHVMLPFEVALMLKRGTKCKSYDEFCRWHGEIVEQILALAEPNPEITSPFSLSERAYCPLCKEGSSAPYEKGFALPIGLERHLEGYGGMIRCVVFNAARRMAWNISRGWREIQIIARLKNCLIGMARRRAAGDETRVF